MQIGESFFQTTNRGLAAALATLGFPLKKEVPVINSYSERKPVPKAPFGHPRWYPGTLRWRFEISSTESESAGKPVLTNKVTREFYDGSEALKLDGYVKALDDAIAAKDQQAIATAWLHLKNALPYILAGYMKFHEANRERLFLPLLKEAYEQQKLTGKGPDIVSVSEGATETHMSSNPTEKLKETLL